MPIFINPGTESPENPAFENADKAKDYFLEDLRIRAAEREV